MGTIGAIHNNWFGLSGVINVNRTRLFAYDSFEYRAYDEYDQALLLSLPIDHLAGLAWLVSNGAKVINISIGGDFAHETSWERDLFKVIYEETLNTLLEHGYDFVVVQSAGNGRSVDGVRVPFDARYNGIFTRVTDSALVDRIIVVGAIDARGNLVNTSNVASNIGDRVDVVAPGHDIFSTVAGYDTDFAFFQGTSMAAPHVTGLAGMVWSANPGLTGPRVKEIIVETANRVVEDDRFTVPVTNQGRYRLVNALAAMGSARDPLPLESPSIVGQVVDAVTERPIVGANVSVVVIAGNDVQQGQRTTTNEYGRYNIQGLQNSLDSRITIQIDAEGYMPETISPITVERGVNVMPTIRAVPLTTVGQTNIRGRIINYETGLMIVDPITLEFRNSFHAEGEIFQTLDVINGQYSIILPRGNYNVRVSGDRFITKQGQIISLPGVYIPRQDIYLSIVHDVHVPTPTPTRGIPTPTIQTTPEPSPTRMPWDLWMPFAPPTPTPFPDGTRAPWPHWEFWDLWRSIHFPYHWGGSGG